LKLLASYGSCAVAYSGGVDSAVVAKAARLALGDAAVLVTGDSAALADGELDAARELAELIGARHVVVSTNEFANPRYIAPSGRIAVITARPNCMRRSETWPPRSEST
jgi:uncharacterized protein